MRSKTTMLGVIAWRNLWRNRRRSLIMLAAIATGVWGMIWMTALMRGMVDQMIEGSIHTLVGHVQVHAQGYSDDPSIDYLMAPVSTRPVLQELLQSDSVTGWSERIRVPGVIRSERDTFGVMLVGIDPARERGLSFIGDGVSEGEPLASPSDNRVVIGRKLLERLRTEPGRRLVAMSQDPENNIAERGFRIAGIYDAELEATETTFVFTGIETLRQMLGSGPGVSELSLLGLDYRDLVGLTARLRALLPDLEVKTWAELDPYTGSMLDVIDGFILVWFVVIFLALSFGLVNTLLMAVFERTREIGLIQALGMQPGYILLMVLIESVIMLLLGLLLGNLVSWATIVPIRDGIDISIVAEGLEWAGMGTRLLPAVVVRDVVTANLVVLVLGILASLLPAWHASRKVPVEAITRIWK